MTRTLALQKITGVLAIGAILVSMFAFLPFSASAESEHKRLASAQRPEMVVTDAGKVLVRGAKVTAVNGATITAQATFGTGVTNWTVITDSATSFYDARGKSGALASIAVNDVVSFAGAVEGSSLFNVRASAVKDWSPTASEAALKGTVSSVNTGALSFVLTAKNGKDSTKNVTVQLSSTTPITLNGSASALGSIAAGDGIKVFGTLSADGSVLTATKVEATRPAPKEDKDFSRVIKHWFNGKGWININF